ncbi:MAG: hypothetical protein M1817_006694 [Caeruleum heppii]|nr:MAG: hypothetical protein M1817_006694 [Caeruleum heppii]
MSRLGVSPQRPEHRVHGDFGPIPDSTPGRVKQHEDLSLNGSQAKARGSLKDSFHLTDLTNGVDPAEFPHSAIEKCCFIGSGYVGGPTGAVVAYKNPQIQVTVVDHDASRIEAWRSPSLPIFEPGLYDIVSVARDGLPYCASGSESGQSCTGCVNGSSTSHDLLAAAHVQGRRPNLHFSTEVDKAVADADVIFICVNTPTKTSGIGRGFASDLGNLETATRTIARSAISSKIVVEKSTVPCRTAESVRAILESNAQAGVFFEVLSNPEFLAEGTAVMDLLCPDRILIGSLPSARGRRAATVLAKLYGHWIPQDRIITMNLWSSELSKIAANALLAQRISSVNALSAICEATGANIDEVAFACGLDKRIGSHMLKAGPGFGGSCFKKDLLSLVYLSESLHLEEVAAYWKSVVTINEYQRDRFTKRIMSCLFDTLTAKKIAVLGFAYKKDTGDTRESAAITLVNNFVAERAEVAIYDPAVHEDQIWRELADAGGPRASLSKLVTVSKSAYDACHNCDAVVIVTEWDFFSNRTEHPDAVLPAFGCPPGQNVNGHLSHESADIRTASRFARCAKNEAATPATSVTAAFSGCEISSSSKAAVAGSLPPALNNGVGQRQKSARLDWARIAAGMKKPRIVFDGRNVVDADHLEELGFVVEAIGKPSRRLRG